jgi:hypothetical protein
MTIVAPHPEVGKTACKDSNMRRVLLALLVALALPTGAPAAHRTPALRLTSVAPLTVHGTGFAARERVRVRVLAPRPLTRRVRATRNGTFHVRFAELVDRCSAFDIRARGGDGSRARLKVQPLCAPP